MRRLDVALTCPDLAAGQPQHGAAVGIDADHGVQQRAIGRALLDLAQAAPVFLRGGELQLAGVLNGQNAVNYVLIKIETAASGKGGKGRNLRKTVSYFFIQFL